MSEKTEGDAPDTPAPVDVRAIALGANPMPDPIRWAGEVVAHVRRPTLAERSAIIAAGEEASDAERGAARKSAARLTRMTVEAVVTLTLTADQSGPLFSAGDRQAIADATSGGLLDRIATRALAGLNVDMGEAGNG